MLEMECTSYQLPHKPHSCMITASPEAAAEQRVVSAFWAHIEQVLTSSCCEGFLRTLAAGLPDPSRLCSAELPVLAKLHLSSAHNLMATLRLLAPDTFAAGASHPDLSALDEADSSLLGMASTLIELQLFHLTRAATLTAHSRHRLAMQRQAGLGCESLSVSVSRSGSGSSSGSEGHWGSQVG